MKIGVLLTSLIFLCAHSLRSQDFEASISYEYLHAQAWNKAVQTYNFSRPFLANPQPLISHGLQASLEYPLPSNGNSNHSLMLDVGWYRSSAENVNFEATLNQYLLQIGYLRPLLQDQLPDQLTLKAGVSVVGGALFRRINGEPLVYDETNAKALGIGGGVRLKVNYYLINNGKIKAGPFLGLQYIPYYYAPKTEAIMNQTTGLTGKEWTSVFGSRLGVIVAFGG
jgi:hypothetical protein